MAHTVTESDTFSATVTVPDDGDAANASSVNGPFGEVTNRSRYLYNRQQLLFPQSDTSGTIYAQSTGTPPTRTSVELLTTGAGGYAWSSTVNWAIEDLSVNDIVTVQGSMQIDRASVVGTPSLAFGIQATSTILDGFMQSLDTAVTTTNPSVINYNFVQIISGAMAPILNLQMVLIAGGGGAGEAVALMSPHNIVINRYRK